MKFLIATLAFTGHINPMQAIAAELVCRGHEVVWLTGDAFKPHVELAGARFVATAACASHDATPLTADPGTSGLAAAVSVLRPLFVDRIPAQVSDYRSVLATFAADALLVDLCALGAHTLHALGGPIYATLGINPLVTPDPEIPSWGTGAQPPRTVIGRFLNQIRHRAADWLFYPRLTALVNRERAALALPPLPHLETFYTVSRSKYLHIMPTTPAFEFPRLNLAPEIHFVGPLLPLQDPQSPFQEPPWWSEMTRHRKVVHVTQGTYATAAGNLIWPTIRALASEDDMLVIVTTPDADTAFPSSDNATSSLPANVRVATFIPHALLLPHVHAMITNAGYNGVLAALSHGVPLVCAGRTEDKADVSSRVAWCGAGIDLATDRPRERQIREAARRVLDETRFRVNAERVRDDFKRHQSAAEAADLLEGLVREKEVRRGPR